LCFRRLFSGIGPLRPEVIRKPTAPGEIFLRPCIKSLQTLRLSAYTSRPTRRESDGRASVGGRVSRSEPGSSQSGRFPRVIRAAPTTTSRGLGGGSVSPLTSHRPAGILGRRHRRRRLCPTRL